MKHYLTTLLLAAALPATSFATDPKKKAAPQKTKQEEECAKLTADVRALQAAILKLRQAFEARKSESDAQLKKLRTEHAATQTKLEMTTGQLEAAHKTASTFDQTNAAFIKKIAELNAAVENGNKQLAATKSTTAQIIKTCESDRAKAAKAAAAAAAKAKADHALIAKLHAENASLKRHCDEGHRLLIGLRTQIENLAVEVGGRPKPEAQPKPKPKAR